jgi:hypothetical protein
VEVRLTLPRAADIRARGYSRRRIVLSWIALCLGGWAVILLLLKAAFLDGLGFGF